MMDEINDKINNDDSPEIDYTKESNLSNLDINDHLLE